MPFLARLVDHAVAYYRDFVRPAKRYRAARRHGARRARRPGPTLRGLPPDASPRTSRTLLYEVGKRHPFADLRAWFGCLYQVLLGQQEGPRFGQFVALYGVAETIALIEPALARPADAA